MLLVRRIIMIQRVLMAVIVLLLLNLLSVMGVNRILGQILYHVTQILIHEAVGIGQWERPLLLGMGIMMQSLRGFMQMSPIIHDQSLHHIRSFVDRLSILLHIRQLNVYFPAIDVLNGEIELQTLMPRRLDMDSERTGIRFIGKYLRLVASG
jgi:hypothetical protein